MRTRFCIMCRWKNIRINGFYLRRQDRKIGLIFKVDSLDQTRSLQMYRCLELIVDAYRFCLVKETLDGRKKDTTSSFGKSRQVIWTHPPILCFFLGLDERGPGWDGMELDIGHSILVLCPSLLSGCSDKVSLLEDKIQ